MKKDAVDFTIDIVLWILCFVASVVCFRAGVIDFVEALRVNASSAEIARATTTIFLGACMGIHLFKK